MLRSKSGTGCHTRLCRWSDRPDTSGRNLPKVHTGHPMLLPVSATSIFPGLCRLLPDCAGLRCWQRALCLVALPTGWVVQHFPNPRCGVGFTFFVRSPVGVCGVGTGGCSRVGVAVRTGVGGRRSRYLPPGTRSTRHPMSWTLWWQGLHNSTRLSMSVRLPRRQNTM